MTSGEGLGTSGVKTGTSGWRMEWTPLALIGVVGVLVAILNATSGIMEAETGGAPIDPRAAWLYEVSSIFMVVVLSPGVGWMMWRFPPPEGFAAPAWVKFAALHLAGACVFSFLHIAGMVAIRTGGYALAGSTYHFDYQGDFLLPAVYEWRKDVLTYAASAACYWVWGVWLAHQAAMALLSAPRPTLAEPRIEIRDGARISLVDPAQISWIEAAGNYVEIHAGGATHLERGTLAAFAEKLAARGFVRVHRSRIVNRARIKAFRPTPSGDLEITLDDDSVIGASRRFRDALENP